MRILSFFLFIALCLGNPIESLAQQMTTVVVHAKAQDAKFIGTSMGGALVTIKNTKTGELLAKGLTEGSTGNTKKLVLSPKKRYEDLHTEGSAKFVAKLSLEKPVFVTISATGPYGYEHAKATTSTQLWLIPGKDITGDGVLLEIPGFVVSVLKPDKTVESNTIPIKAKVVMMCGCPTKPDGVWDSSEYDITALVYHKGEKVGEVPLEFSGKTNIYTGNYQTNQPGEYTISVYAYHAETGNTGLDKTTVTVE